MAQIMEVFEDIREGIGDKGFMILMGGAVAFGLYQLSKGSGSGGQMTTVSTVTSYPDAVTNANVIIDSLQNSIDYSEAQIREDIQGLTDNINTKFDVTNESIVSGFQTTNDNINSNFEATNDYINKGIESNMQILDKVSGLENRVETIGNISAMTYYELMLQQGRDGYVSDSRNNALKALENAGFDTSGEYGTTTSGGKVNIYKGGWTTFTGSNIKK